MSRRPTTTSANDRAESTGLFDADDIVAGIRERFPDMTRAERTIASYMIEHLSTLPFETGASLAEKTGVSEMTVIRFIRTLGFDNLKSFKAFLRERHHTADPELDNILERFQLRSDHLASLEDSLKAEVSAIVKAYEQTSTPQWPQIVELLAKAQSVHVVGFQATSGLARDFASRLKYARPGVRFAEGATGTLSEVLEQDPATGCVVLVDTVALARKGVALARKAHDLGLPLVIVTDRFSDWAYEHTELVLQANTHVKLFWDSSAGLSVILNLLIDAIAAELGEAAQERFRFMVDLGAHFKEFEPMYRPGPNGTKAPSR